MARMSQALRIVHTTEYHYREPVEFGPHRAMIRPREGHDLHIRSSILEVSPSAGVRWLRDIYGNSIAVLTFAGPARRLRVHSEAVVDLYPDDLPHDPAGAGAAGYPFQYGPEEQVEIVSYRIPSYPHDGPAVLDWLGRIYEPGMTISAYDLLHELNRCIHGSFRYIHREESGVQLPCESLAKGSGSCRDYAVFMMEAARHWGFAARFVTGYVRMAEGQHGATHAWTEIYLPGFGWQGYDPTNNKLAGAEHVAVGVARGQEKAAPIAGTWAGPRDAFERMEVVVRVEAA
jgi:transglutaminase-like putative cysteine protease